MGAVDAAIKEFMADKQNFADAFNLGLFHRRIVSPERLEQANPNLVAGRYPDGAKRIMREVERTLDDARIAQAVMRDGKATYILLGMQYQRHVHYAMPVRNLLETALLYAQQVRDIDAGNRKKETARKREIENNARKLSSDWEETERDKEEEGAGEGAETDGPEASGVFLSGLGPGDKLHPVIILVLYLGEHPWDAPGSLYEMLETEDPELLQYCCDYRLNLVTPERIPDNAEYRGSEFWKAMYALRMGHLGLNELIQLAESREFESVQPSTVRLLNTVLQTDLAIPAQNGGRVNMCKAMREYAQLKTQLAVRDRQYAEQKVQLEERARQYAEKDRQYAEKDRQYAELQRELAELKARFGVS